MVMVDVVQGRWRCGARWIYSILFKGKKSRVERKSATRRRRRPEGVVEAFETERREACSRMIEYGSTGRAVSVSMAVKVVRDYGIAFTS